MRIIGHRGAAGLALENTLPSIELARLLGVDAIEIDVRKTKDGQLVVCHDQDMSRVSKSDVKISDRTYKELSHILLNDEHSTLPLLSEALKMAGSTPVIIELKETGCIDALLAVLDKFPEIKVTVASFNWPELLAVREARPELKLFALERTKLFDVIQFVRLNKLHGIGLNFWLLNPFTYFLVKRYKLELYVFTVNNRLFGQFIRFLYPKARICTNHPEWFIKHPWLKLRQSAFRAPRSNNKQP